jgi:hypothetical protein
LLSNVTKVKSLRVIPCFAASFLVAAVCAAAPAQADVDPNAFLSALNDAGVGYDNPAAAVALGQSICPMLSQPGGDFASVASQMTGHDGISAEMAGLFTSIAISMYCPSAVASFANGDWLENGTLPGLPFPIPGLEWLPRQ